MLVPSEIMLTDPTFYFNNELVNVESKCCLSIVHVIKWNWSTCVHHLIDRVKLCKPRCTYSKCIRISSNRSYTTGRTSSSWSNGGFHFLSANNEEKNQTNERNESYLPLAQISLMGLLHNSEHFPSQSLTFHVNVRWKSMWGGSLVGLKNSPTQLPTHGQWWSNLAMHRLQTAQCFDLIGFRICGEQAVKVSVLCTGTSVEIAMQIRLLSYQLANTDCVQAAVCRMKDGHNYQTGAAEYAEIQRACFCQFNYSLKREEEKT